MQAAVKLNSIRQRGHPIIDKPAIAAEFCQLQHDQPANVRIVLDHQHAAAHAGTCIGNRLKISSTGRINANIVGGAYWGIVPASVSDPTRPR